MGDAVCSFLGALRTEVQRRELDRLHQSLDHIEDDCDLGRCGGIVPAGPSLAFMRRNASQGLHAGSKIRGQAAEIKRSPPVSPCEKDLHVVF